MDTVVQQIPPGEPIGPYQVVRKLGAGGMGEVYLARHRHLNRDAAVKVLLAEISMNQTVVARFFTEARATAQLRHPNIVEIFDCDVLPDGRAYIVMEYLRGESLRATLDRVRRLSPDWASIVAIAGMVAGGLQAAHESGIVHRDLKPDNTYLTCAPGQRDELVVKILDFGIAKLLSGERTGSGSTPTRTGSLIGTPLYMSPEQCRGISTIDHRADIYSLGCMMYEMIVGQPPFLSEAPGDILMAHIMTPAPALSSLEPEVPPPIAALVAQMLAKDPAARPQSMAEIVAAAEALLGLRRSELGKALRRPVGFPDAAAAAQIATQILPPESSTASPALTPGARVAATPAAPSPPSAALTVAEPRRERAPAAGSSKSGSPSGSASPRGKSASESGRRAARPETEYATIDGGPSPSSVRRFLPAAIIAAVVAIGGSAAYQLTRPRRSSEYAETGTPAAAVAPAAPPTSTESAAPAEVTIEMVSAPEGAVVTVAGAPRGHTPTKLTLPRSSSGVEVVLQAEGYLEKHLSIDASRDRTMTIKLEPRESAQPRVGDRRVEDKGKGPVQEQPREPSRKKRTGKTAGEQFKAVGD